MNQLLRRKAFADLLGVTGRVVTYWFQQGLPHYTITASKGGKTVFVDVAEAKVWLAQHPNPTVRKLAAKIPQEGGNHNPC